MTEAMDGLFLLLFRKGANRRGGGGGNGGIEESVLSTTLRWRLFSFPVGSRFFFSVNSILTTTSLLRRNSYILSRGF